MGAGGERRERDLSRSAQNVPELFDYVRTLIDAKPEAWGSVNLLYAKSGALGIQRPLASSCDIDMFRTQISLVAFVDLCVCIFQVRGEPSGIKQRHLQAVPV